MTPDDLRRLVRDIPDFPKPGILFRDITTLLADPAGLQGTCDALADAFADESDIDLVVGIEARGFILGAPVALALNAGFVPARKPGKLPGETVRVEYDLEYGSTAIELHQDAIAAGQRVLIIDDVLATGGTVRAVRDLVQRLGGQIVGLGFLIELSALGGREGIDDLRIESILAY